MTNRNLIYFWKGIVRFIYLFEGTLNVFVSIFIIIWCKFFSKLMYINLFGENKFLNFEIVCLIYINTFNMV